MVADRLFVLLLVRICKPQTEQTCAKKHHSPSEAPVLGREAFGVSFFLPESSSRCMRCSAVFVNGSLTRKMERCSSWCARGDGARVQVQSQPNQPTSTPWSCVPAPRWPENCRPNWNLFVQMILFRASLTAHTTDGSIPRHVLTWSLWSRPKKSTGHVPAALFWGWLSFVA